MYFVVKNTAVQYPSNVQWCRLIGPFCVRSIFVHKLDQETVYGVVTVLFG